MKTESKLMPVWAQLACGIAFLTLALAAGILSLAMNVYTGAAIGLAVAIAFGLSDVAKMMIPMICQASGWTGHLRATYYATSAVSVICALYCLAGQFAGDIAGRENAQAITSNAEQRVQDLRSTLATLTAQQRAMGAQRAAGVIAAEIEGGKQDKAWRTSNGCVDATRKASREFCEAHFARVAEHAASQKAEQVQRDILSVQTKIATAGERRETIDVAKAAGAETVLAAMFGTDEATTARGISIALILAALLVTELCSHTSGMAANTIGAAMQRRRDAKPAAETSQEEIAKPAEPVAKAVQAVAKAPANGSRAYYLARLECEFPAIAARVQTGELSVFRASVQAGLRKAPANAKWAKVEAYA